jgi:NAD(P)-dependent dehydrogenase (short-subunit alcohol dehydrogenase family)
MTITLITGANKGLGHETARRLLEIGHTVLVGARDAERGQRAADELGGVFLKIDQTSVGSFARLLTPGTVEHAVTLPVYPATKATLTMLTVQ